MRNNPVIIGWEEWCSFPDIGLPAIRAKVDTGAKTSALHAFNINHYIERDKEFVKFDIHPVHKDKRFVRSCIAPMIDRRYVSDSGGHKEQRYVIKTLIKLGRFIWEIEITLANRDHMSFRMLLGREALRHGKIIVDPAKSCLQGKIKLEEVRKLYRR